MTNNVIEEMYELQNVSNLVGVALEQKLLGIGMIWVFCFVSFFFSFFSFSNVHFKEN